MVFFFSLDYVKFFNENNLIFGKFCGIEIGWIVIVIGGYDYVVIIFYYDYSWLGRGFLILFIIFLDGSWCEVIMWLF